LQPRIERRTYAGMTDRHDDQVPRRRFLAATGAAACSLGLAACMHTNAARIVSPPVAGGTIHLKIADQPELATVGGAIKLKPAGVDDTILLWRSGESSFEATSIICTHMGCEVEVAEGGKSLACPCHGSQYDADGTVKHGPAGRALKKYPVDVSADHSELTVHTA
jgi:cytochrome b6-f complex iron-sulfur subunit